MEKQTLKQFFMLKDKHPDCLLLFRTGDFYVSYQSDAKVCANLLGITLGKKENIFKSSFPHYKLDEFLPKLIRAGKRVAICDQLEDPRLTKKLVKRSS